MIKSKQKYFDRIYSEAKTVACACGCGILIKNKDRYGRNKRFISGHNGRKYKDPKQYQREWNRRNKVARYLWKMKRHRRLKVELINLMGGECSKCGLKYSGKNACVFHLHHRPKFKKIFEIGNQLTNKAWRHILKEAKKCILVCSNCHETMR